MPLSPKKAYVSVSTLTVFCRRMRSKRKTYLAFLKAGSSCNNAAVRGGFQVVFVVHEHLKSPSSSSRLQMLKTTSSQNEHNHAHIIYFSSSLEVFRTPIQSLVLCLNALLRHRPVFKHDFFGFNVLWSNANIKHQIIFFSNCIFNFLSLFMRHQTTNRKEGMR